MFYCTIHRLYSTKCATGRDRMAAVLKKKKLRVVSQAAGKFSSYSAFLQNK